MYSIRYLSLSTLSRMLLCVFISASPAFCEPSVGGAAPTTACAFSKLYLRRKHKSFAPLQPTNMNFADQLWNLPVTSKKFPVLQK